MKMRLLPWSVVFVILTGLAACNIFNPSGGTEAVGDDADALISYAQKLYRRAEYREAASLFSKAIAKDSTKSEAYFGLAKAGMRAAGANPMDFLRLVSLNSQENKIPFMTEAQEIQNTVYRSMIAVDTALRPLIRRDTLTAWWELSRAVYLGQISRNALHSNPAKADSLARGLSRFENTYGAYPNSMDGMQKFPLTDRKYKYARFMVDYTLSAFIVTVLGFLDFNRDGYINSDDIPIKISFDPETGLPVVDVQQVMDAALSNPAVADALNNNLELLASGSGNLTEILSNMAGQLGLTDSAGGQLTEETKAAIDSQITQLGNTALFYKLGDGKDNDGDGCIDEEVFDSLDNDLDGLKDEDLRLLNPLGFGLDNRDNDGDGLVDETDEVYNPAQIEPGAPRPHPFTAGFINTAAEYGSMPNQSDLAIKQSIVNDKDGQISLEERKRRIGGCWVYYDELLFQQYLTNHR